MDPGEVASELLTKVVDTINRQTSYQNQIASLNNQILELEGTLKKEKEEKERILKSYNDLVKQGGDKVIRFPTIGSILSARDKR